MKFTESLCITYVELEMSKIKSTFVFSGNKTDFVRLGHIYH